MAALHLSSTVYLLGHFQGKYSFSFKNPIIHQAKTLKFEHLDQVRGGTIWQQNVSQSVCYFLLAQQYILLLQGRKSI